MTLAAGIAIACLCLLSTRIALATESADVEVSVETRAHLSMNLSRGSACRAACWGAAALGCGIVSSACVGTTVITIGGATIPCTWAAIAACTAGTIGASLCADSCPP